MMNQANNQASEGAFLMDVRSLRDNARAHIENGAMTDSYQGNVHTVIDLLNTALATELICTLRYRRHYYMANGINARQVADEFLEHAVQEQEHADKLAERIVQLGGEPDFNPDNLLSRSHSDYIECKSLAEMIKENLIAERIAIDSYRQMIDYVGESDPTTRRVLEDILAVEEEHADDMAGFMEGLKQ